MGSSKVLSGATSRVTAFIPGFHLVEGTHSWGSGLGVGGLKILVGGLK